MANDLTGVFDVVAEFSMTGVNRLLATMHRLERFPHSMSVRVDDRPPPGPRFPRPTLVAALDELGDPVADHGRIGRSVPLSELLGGANAAHSMLDSAVNLNTAGISLDPVISSNLQGRAQLQLSPPTIEVPDASGDKIRVRLQFMSRYFPDHNTSPAAEFVRGELAITAAVTQSDTAAGTIVDVDIKSNTTLINFTPYWSSRQLTAEDLAGITQLIRNALRTSFQPSNSPLHPPSKIKHASFRTLPGPPNAVAALINIESDSVQPTSVHHVFLGGLDDFAFAVGIDFVRSVFQPTIDGLKSRQIKPGWSYTVSVNSVTVELKNGKILFTTKGHAHTPHWYLPDFDYTVKQPFTLEADGPTANLIVGDMSFDSTSTLANWLQGAFVDDIKKSRDESLAESKPGEVPHRDSAFKTVRDLLNADDNLGGFFDSMLSPPDGPVTHVPGAVSLTYDSVEIRDDNGIVLHGSLSVRAWPAAHVEYQQLPTQPHGPGGLGGAETVFDGPEYSALKSWIPGGMVTEYEWQPHGQGQPGTIDDNRFVLLPQGPTSVEAGTSPAVSGNTHITTGELSGVTISPVRGFTPFCLTVRGSRIRSDGSGAAESVTATACMFDTFPVVNGMVLAASGPLPHITLTRPGRGGLVEVAGHTAARADKSGSRTPNMIIHFADERSSRGLEIFPQALRESDRRDAASAVLVVMTPEQLAKARYAEGVIYSEDEDGAWERRFGVKSERRPVTLLVAPNGKVTWQHEGEIDGASLAAALRRYLVKQSPITARIVPSVRIGHRPPNFLVDYALDRQVTLRKLAGRSPILVFWKSSSKPSIDAVRDVQRMAAESEGDEPLVLAINDGETREVARRFAAANGLSATLVMDPDRSISLAYRVSIWPTIVFIDTLGLVRTVQYGRNGTAQDMEQSKR